MKHLLRHDVVRLTTPIFLEQLFVNLLGSINAVMAARIGRAAVAAIGMVDTINLLVSAIFSALAIGATVIVAQFYGRREIQRAGEAARQAMVISTLLAAAIGILTMLAHSQILSVLYGEPGPVVTEYMHQYLLITAGTYPLTALTLVISGALRGAGETRLAMQANTLMNIANVLLGYVLIYGIDIPVAGLQLQLPGAGVAGAAWAISLARLTGCAYLLYALARQQHLLPVRWQAFHFEPALLHAFFSIGLPACMESLVFNGGKLLVQVMVVSMGTAAVAASFIGFSVSTLLNIPGNALAVALTTLVGQAVGRNDERQAGYDMWYVLCLSTVIMTLIGIVTWPLAESMVRLYSTDPDVLSLGAGLVRLNCLFLAVFSSTFVLPSGLKGAGDARYTMVTTIIGMCACRIVLGYVLGVICGWGIMGVWLGMFADWLIRSTLYLIRLSRGQWKGRQILG